MAGIALISLSCSTLILLLVTICDARDVFKIQAAAGRYQIKSRQEASDLCKSNYGRIANFDDVNIALIMGNLEYCECGYIEDGRVVLPVYESSPEYCTTEAGMSYCPSSPSEWGETGWDGYCLRVGTPPPTQAASSTTTETSVVTPPPTQAASSTTTETSVVTDATTPEVDFTPAPPGDPNVEEMSCHFPFTYNGVEYSKCIAPFGDKPWCAVTAEYSSLSWRYCSEEDVVAELPCHIPFLYNGKEENMCIKAGSSEFWCATAAEYGTHDWRNCAHGDPIPEDLPCHFPFLFEGTEQTTCIDKGAAKSWCAVERDYNGENWRYCRDGDKFAAEPPCHFPFDYNGELVSSCISLNSNRPWCSLQAKYDTTNWRYCRQVDIRLLNDKVTSVTEAESKCAMNGMKLSTIRDVKAAYDTGEATCTCGWISNGNLVNLIHKPSEDCGGENSSAGVNECPSSSDEHGPICTLE